MCVCVYVNGCAGHVIVNKLLYMENSIVEINVAPNKLIMKMGNGNHHNASIFKPYITDFVRYTSLLNSLTIHSETYIKYK